MATDSVINRFSSVATDPLRSFRFYVEFLAPQQGSKVSNKITGFSGGFTQVSGLGINTQSIAYREGGYNTTIHQIPGMTTFVPVTFQRGVLYGNDQAITWMKGLFSAASGEGLNTGTNKNFRVNIDIYVMDHPNASATPGTPADDNLPRMRFRVHNAWITGLNYNELNAGDGGILFESMTLVHEGLSVSFVDSSFKPIPKQ